jgi:transposase
MDEGCMETKRARRVRKSMVRTIGDAVEAAMAANPYLTAIDLIGHVARTIGTNVSESTISRCRRSRGLRYKRVQRAQHVEDVDPSHPFMANDVYDGAITLDEASFVSIDRPTRGWAKGSERVGKGAPRGRSRISLLLAIDAGGVVAYDIRKGSFNSDMYAEFLKRLPPGRTLIMDNCSIHRSAVAKSAAEGRGQTLVFTPPYSPWFNPTEFIFSKTKAAYRRARLDGRTDFVVDVVSALATVSAADCAGCFNHSRRVRLAELEKSSSVGLKG